MKLHSLEKVVGIHPVREALRARRRSLNVLYLRDNLKPALARALELEATDAGVRTERVSAERLAAMSPPGLRNQGALLEGGGLPDIGLPALLEQGRTEGLIVALDGVEDPQNFGALVRVAEAAGASGLLTTTRRSPPLGPVVARASAGAVEHLPIVRVANMARALRESQKGGLWVLGLDSNAGTQLTDPAVGNLWTGPLVVVLGSEGRGIRPGIARLLDEVIRIPLRGQVEALNVSTAAAVALFEIQRRRASL